MRRLCGLAIAAIGLSASLPSAHAQVTATGGTITSYTDGGITYDVHTFTGSGTFDVTAGGSVDYLIVGGGGGGGGGTGGGGGAGGFVTGTTTVTDSTAYTITVGGGGAGGTTSSPYRGANGDDSIFAGVTAVGGGGGGSNYPTSPGFTDPSVGGSGGGGSGGAGRPGAFGTNLQGNAGGNVLSWGGPFTPGGGGGAGAAGTNGNGQGAGAAGGAGLSSSISGIAKFYAGGGGSGNFNGNGGLGGLGGGGNGGNPGSPTSGAANTGGGGGGQRQNNGAAAGSGGSGVVIIRFISTSPNPTSTNATLAALENTATPLAASNFGYADPGSVALAAVEITSLPALGTLTYNGNPVANNDIIAAANIGNLSYLSPLGGFGSPYTTMGIKVQNANTLWSSDALMTVNVTDVNQAPTSTGGSVILRKNTVKTFAAANFPFSDIDAGNTLQAIKVTSLPNPTNGTLTLSASAVTLNQVVDVADITAGNLIYTPVTDYTGSDPFNFQVRDADLFSADATMAITVTPDIIVQNPSFETIGASLGGPWATAAAVWNASLTYAQTNDNARFATRTDAGIWYANLTDPGNTFFQNLGVSVTSGDTLAVTFYAGRENGQPGGIMAATFLVDSAPYTETFDTTGLTPGTWQSYTLTKTIANSGALTLRFSNVSDRPWLDNISNISVTTGGGPTPGSFADWALTNAPGQLPSQDYNNDGVQNGVAYFMGVTGLATNPGPDASNTVTWPKSATYQGTFEVQTSTDLGTWTPADPQPTPSGGNLTYTLPPGAPGGKSFVRLLVTPN